MSDETSEPVPARKRGELAEVTNLVCKALMPPMGITGSAADIANGILVTHAELIALKARFRMIAARLEWRAHEDARLSKEAADESGKKHFATSCSISRDVAAQIRAALVEPDPYS